MTNCAYSKCQKPFEPFRSTHVYCSTLCGQRDREIIHYERFAERRRKYWLKKKDKKVLEVESK